MPQKKLGILGGMSWVSSAQYYRLINKSINSKLGRQHSAAVVMESIDFQAIVDAQVKGRWDLAGQILSNAAQAAERAGAEAFLIASNTMHKVFGQVEKSVSIPGLNIFDTVAAAIAAKSMRRVALMGTRYTMADSFYAEEYAQRQIDVLIPEKEDARLINAVIFKELIHDIITDQAKDLFKTAIRRLADRGAEGVILGCTEINLVVDPADCLIPAFDSTSIHADAAVNWMVMKRSSS